MYFGSPHPHVPRPSSLSLTPRSPPILQAELAFLVAAGNVSAEMGGVLFSMLSIRAHQVLCTLRYWRMSPRCPTWQAYILSARGRLECLVDIAYVHVLSTCTVHPFHLFGPTYPNLELVTVPHTCQSPRSFTCARRDPPFSIDVCIISCSRFQSSFLSFLSSQKSHGQI